MKISTNDVSPLSVLSPVAEPDCQRLLLDLKIALNRASTNGVDLWPRMENNHNARYCWWPNQDWSCRKRLRPGERPPQPWENAADLRVRLVDTIITEYGDLLDLAEARVVPRLLPGMMDPGDMQAQMKAEAWSAVNEHYGELAEYDLQRAKSRWRDIGWEYGHGISYVGWQEERQMMPRVLDAETVVRLVAAVEIGEVVEEAASINGSAAGVVEGALVNAEVLVMDRTMKPLLIDKLREIDPEMPLKEARRVAGVLRTGRPVTYFVPRIVRACPEMLALTPGLDVFYPYETATIQKARFIVLPEWWSDVEMRANVTTRGWSARAVEKVVETARMGRAEFFGLSDLQCMSVGWLLTGGMLGMGVRTYDYALDKDSRQWQVLRVFYKATDPDTGVPVLYSTTFHPDVPDAPLKHEASVDDHARYPFNEYIREFGAASLWSSRGVGELSYAEQDELKHQADFAFDNATIAIKPPYEVNSRSEVAKGGLGPGTRVVTSSSFSTGGGVQKIDIAGDPKASVTVQQQTLARVNNYFKMGNSPELDPIAKQVAQQARVNQWVLSVKQAQKMIFATVQQHCPAEIKASAINGRPVNLNVTREEIQGDFTLHMEFDVASLDPKAIEARAKMVREMVAPLDREGLLQTEPLLRMLMSAIHPRWGQLIVNTSGAARQEQVDEAINNVMRAANGVEPKYLSGGNPQLRAEITKKLLTMPALDMKGEPIPGADGRPMPGFLQTVAELRPDIAALFGNLLKHEEFEAAQQENVDIGRKGVKEIQGVDGRGSA